MDQQVKLSPAAELAKTQCVHAIGQLQARLAAGLTAPKEGERVQQLIGIVRPEDPIRASALQRMLSISIDSAVADYERQSAKSGGGTKYVVYTILGALAALNLVAVFFASSADGIIGLIAIAIGWA